MKFPCTHSDDGNVVTIDKCQKCKKHHNCDIYAVALDDIEEDDCYD